MTLYKAQKKVLSEQIPAAVCLVKLSDDLTNCHMTHDCCHLEWPGFAMHIKTPGHLRAWYDICSSR